LLAGLCWRETTRSAISDMCQNSTNAHMAVEHSQSFGLLVQGFGTRGADQWTASESAE